ncbi:MAG: MFS transporter [Stackebrandtia sp.]
MDAPRRRAVAAATPLARPSRSTRSGRFARTGARLLVLAIVSLGLVFTMPSTASAEDCTDQQWHDDFQNCVDELPPPDSRPSECKEPPIPGSPDSGMAGWFAERPEWFDDKDYQDGKYRVPAGQYSQYGYAGYDLPVYDMGCFDSFAPEGDDVGNSLANLEFTMSTGIIGASNGLRDAAWTPGNLWGWADEFVEKASKAIVERVFTPFGAITLLLVGLYLIWRSRQADMSMAVTTAGWAVLILVVVTAVARWPVEAADRADATLTAGLSTVQGALDPAESSSCEGQCKDVRTAAEKSSDMVTGEILYHNWIRAVLGNGEEVEYKRNSDGDVVNDDEGNPIVESGNAAYKYGPALYDAQAMTWEEIERARSSPEDRKELVADKQEQWQRVAEAIKQEDPEAYENLTGSKGWDRVGTGFLALLSAVFFALFDITASILIVLGFLMIRWAVIAIPLIGTVAMLRPASGGFKRLISAVLAACINVVVFGIAAAVYLYAVAQILSANLAGWLQVLLIALTGAVAWMLLRPYRRIASFKGGSSIAEAAFGRRHSSKEKEKVVVKDTSGRKEEPPDSRGDPPDSRDPIMGSPRKRDNASPQGSSGGDAASGLPPRPVPGQGMRAEPSSSSSSSGYSVYRPSGSGAGSRAGDRPLVSVRPD